MMKKKILFPILSSLFLLFGSCENNFDAHIYGDLIQGKYPSTEDEYVSYMMTCYIPFTSVFTYQINSGTGQHGFYIATGGNIRMFDSTSDIMAPAVVKCSDEWLRLSQANYENCYYYWRGWVDDANNLNHFPKTAEVTRFTEIIGTLEKASEDVLSKEKKNSLLGEARLCRGMMLYYLMHIYGPVPVIINPEDVFNEEALGNTVRPTLTEMCEWITDDLDFAANNAPETTLEKGRYTRDYARFCLMRHCLNEGGYMDGYYQKALDMYEALKGKYSLFKSGSNPYTDLFKNANKFNNEIIMAVSCDPNADGNPKNGNANVLSWLVVPNEASAMDPTGNRTPFYPQNGGWNAFYNVAPKFYNTFEKDDLRKEAILTEYWTKDGIKVTKNDIGVKWDGFICNKFPVETPGTFQGTDIPLARWADVLLMYAEAEVRLSKAAPTASAISAVNEVRNRANGSVVADRDIYKTTMSYDDLAEAAYNEHGWEIAGYYWGNIATRARDMFRMNRIKDHFEYRKLNPEIEVAPGVFRKEAVSVSGTWNDSKMYLPRPFVDSSINPNLKN